MHRRGFTLIELLVVISIISLLSSVVLASLNTAREKARLGAGRQFNAQAEHLAGDSLVGAWDYDECTGGSGSHTEDRSGYGSYGTLNSAASWSTDTPSGTGCSIYWDGTNGMGYAGGSTPAQFQFGMGSFTISGWINPVVVNIHNSIFSSWGSPQRIALGLDPWGSDAVLSYILKDSNSNQSSDFFTKIIPYNKWSHLLMSVDRTANVAKFYVDGAFYTSVSIASLNGDMNFTAGPGTAVSWGGAGAYLKGKVDTVRVYAKALTAEEVARQYAIESSRANFAQR